MRSLPIIIIIVACFFLVSHQFARNAPLEKPKISLHIEGHAAQWVQLRSVHENVKTKLDSIRLDAAGNGLFTYPKALEPGYYELVLSEDETLPILLDQDQTFSIQTNTDQLVGNLKVEGSLENTLFYKNLQYDIDLQERFQAEIQQLQLETPQLNQEQINALRDKYLTEKSDFLEGLFRKHPKTLFTSLEKAKQGPQNINSIMENPDIEPNQKQEMVLKDFWATFNFNDERLLYTPIAFDKIWQYFVEFVPNQTPIKIQAMDVLLQEVADHPAYAEFFSTWLANDYLPPFTGQMDPDAIYTHLVNNYLTEEKAPWADSMQVYAWQLRAKDKAVSLVGMQGANFEAQKPDGSLQSLEDIKAPYLALFFYHYDCDHCIETAPKLAAQYQELKAQGLEVVAVAMDTPREEWKKFIKEHKMNWINVTDEDNKSIYDNYSVWATPEIMLLDPNRTIIGKHLTIEDIPMLMQADRLGRTQSAKAISSAK